MFKFATLFICTMLLFCKPVFASVSITEIAWMGTAESQFGEWIELYNDSSESISLAGWKLYEAGGEQLIFTLTKTIPSESYLLIERTTASSPDPVPGVNDESGSFGGSGLSNTGEYLVLKNSGGTIEQSLNFLSGWPAGDATTKQTMQWDGSKWITSSPTPKASVQKGADENPEETKKDLSTAWSAPRSEPHIEISIPKNIYTKVSAEFSAKTFLEFGQAYNGLFLWNMGDGTVYKSSSPKNIYHTYEYPGLYTISFAYYRAPYENKPFLSSSIEKTVVNSGLGFRVVKNQGFEFTNADVVPVDISGWFIELPDYQLVELPPFSIVASKKTVLMPFKVFGLPSSKYIDAKLQTPERTYTLEQPKIQEKETISIKTSLPASASGSFTNTKDDIDVKSDSILEDISKTKQETKPDENNNKKKLLFFGILVLVVSLFILSEKKMKQE